MFYAVRYCRGFEGWFSKIEVWVRQKATWGQKSLPQIVQQLFGEWRQMHKLSVDLQVTLTCNMLRSELDMLSQKHMIQRWVTRRLNVDIRVNKHMSVQLHNRLVWFQNWELIHTFLCTCCHECTPEQVWFAWLLHHDCHVGCSQVES